MEEEVELNRILLYVLHRCCSFRYSRIIERQLDSLTSLPDLSMSPLRQVWIRDVVVSP
jgi:hypothetical protein